jgi:hypothetical protein
MISTLPYSDALYGISTPPEGRTLFSEFLLFTCNEYKLGLVQGFLDAAWGLVEGSELKEKPRDLDRIKPKVEQHINVREEMFNVGKVRSVGSLLIFWPLFTRPAHWKSLQATRHAETFEVIGLEDKRITLRHHLRACYERGSGPVCVVVHDWPKAKVALKVMGVDTSTWSTDIRSAMQGKSRAYDRKPSE